MLNQVTPAQVEGCVDEVHEGHVVDRFLIQLNTIHPSQLEVSMLRSNLVSAEVLWRNTKALGLADPDSFLRRLLKMAIYTCASFDVWIVKVFQYLLDDDGVLKNGHCERQCVSHFKLKFRMSFFSEVTIIGGKNRVVLLDRKT